MDEIEKLVGDVDSIKIQGATSVAKAGLKGFILISKGSSAKSKKELLDELKEFSKRITSVRSVEPLLKNLLNFVLKNVSSSSVEELSEVRQMIGVGCEEALKMVENDKALISKIGSELIKDGMKILTHCHSSTVMDIFKAAKKEGKKFEVICSESRPLFQGRKSAKDILKMKVPVSMVIDSNVANIIGGVDLVLIGCDLLAADGSAVNKVGSNGISLLAKMSNIPLYVCTDLKKFDFSTLSGKGFTIEERESKEVWIKAPDKIKIFNPAFDIVSSENITGVVCQDGVLKSNEAVELIKSKKEWIIE